MTSLVPFLWWSSGKFNRITK